MNDEERGKANYRNQKSKNDAKLTEKVRKFREDLLEREKKNNNDFPQKRKFREEASELPKIVYHGIKVIWRENRVYTEEILHQIFSDYGLIQKIITKKNTSAFLIFVNIMACDRIIAKPPAQFIIKRITTEKCEVLLKNIGKTKEKNSELSEKLNLLKLKLKEKNSNTI